MFFLFQAQCDYLEDSVYNLQKELQERDHQLCLMKESLCLRTVEIENLKKSLRFVVKNEFILNLICRHICEFL